MSDTKETEKKKSKKSKMIEKDEVESSKAQKHKLKKTAHKNPKKRKDDPKEDSSELHFHSANHWENVDMGDENRTKKFLRLMGGAHQSKVEQDAEVIEEEVVESKRVAGANVEHLTQDLEEQFKQGLEHRGFGKIHAGLGFHDKKTVLDASSECKVTSDNDLKAAYKNQFVKGGK